MPRRCSVCSHAQCEQINSALLSGGTTLRDISNLFELSKSSLARHQSGCLSSALARVEVAKDETLAATWSRIRSELNTLITDAKAAKDQRLLLGALAQLSKLVDSGLKAAELHANTTADAGLEHHPQWPAFVAVVLCALDPHPEARAAVADAMRELST